ncbi:MAG TPA: PQQ-dependent sugar dehydrogenase [Tepidisphaeraceae bacterium]|jgi:putative heme-binding domain-containing protein|nr:PQQ-dependent sugar dehydrogenase [Tepidisphaeraceae bacterium]
MTPTDLSAPRNARGGIFLATLALLIILSGAAGLWWWVHQPSPYGIDQRAAWTVSKVVGAPEPPDPFLTQRIFPKLKFIRPLDIAFAPGSDRVFIVQHDGKIFSFPNQNDVEKADLMLDATKLDGLARIPNYFGVEVYGLTFHPQFQKNHFCYVSYHIDFPYKRAVDYSNAYPQNKTAQRVSRFTVSDTDPPTIDPSTEKRIIAWNGGGHMGACMKFGPDGDLYVSTGDNGDPNPPDPHNIGQNIGDLRSKLLRIDVDHAVGDEPYAIPADNPFVHTPGARGEVFAYGLRNPWKFSFDSVGGNIWAGDVGWELWESVFHVVSGGNYGWSIMEGPQPVYPNKKRGPTPIIPPAAALPHTEAASITGGFVYHGKENPALDNQYVFGDWETRRIWAAPVDGGKMGKYRTIAQTDQRVVAFGEDAKGELYIVDYEGGGIWRLAPNPTVGSELTFPRKLSQTGLFANVAKQIPSPGVVPFGINAPQWVDGSTSERFIAVPGAGVVVDGVDGKRVYPKNTVLVRTLSLNMTDNDAASRRRIETQLLHFDGRQWHGYAYQWDDSQNDAALVDGDGRDLPLTIIDPAAPDGRRLQTWHFNSRAQCMTCHTQWSGYVMAFSEPQLDRTEKFVTGDSVVSDNQLRTFRHIGLIPEVALPKPQKDGSFPPPPIPTVLVNPQDETFTLNDRARSYLHVNCSVCHRFGGGGTALIELREDKTLKETKLLTNPMLGTFNIADAEIVCPGDPSRSVLYYRMAKSGTGRMPHLGATVVDEKGLNLIADWIVSLRDTAGGTSAGAATLGESAEQNAAMQSLKAGASGADAIAAVDRLLASTNGALKLVVALEAGEVSPGIRPMAAQHAMSSTSDVIRDLFARFSPQSASAGLDVAKALELHGSADKGRKIFFELNGGLCAKCHMVANEGKDFGPNLSMIGAKYNKADILDNILHPSKTIAPGFEAYIVRTKTGDILAGFLISKNESEVVLKTQDASRLRLKADDVDKMVQQPISAMPEGLLIGLDSQQVADLLEFLATKK